MKKVFLTILQNSDENTCVGVSFNKVAALKAFNLIKKRLQQRLFHVNIATFLRTPILKSIYERLILLVVSVTICLENSCNKI